MHTEIETYNEAARKERFRTGVRLWEFLGDEKPPETQAHIGYHHQVVGDHLDNAIGDPIAGVGYSQEYVVRLTRAQFDGGDVTEDTVNLNLLNLLALAGAVIQPDEVGTVDVLDILARAFVATKARLSEEDPAPDPAAHAPAFDAWVHA